MRARGLTCNRTCKVGSEAPSHLKHLPVAVVPQEHEKNAIPEAMTTVTTEIAALEEKLGRLKILQPKQLRCDHPSKNCLNLVEYS